MATRRKQPLPKTQREISQDLIQPYSVGSNKLDDNSKKREYQRKVGDSDVKRFSVGLRDIDETIIYYFNNVIQPTVIQNNSKLNVPILYGSPERWASVQKDGFYRDKNGKIQAPLIMFKRDSLEKNRELGNKLDANNPSNFGIFQKRFSKQNIYDKFSVLTNREKIQEYYGVIIPDYVTLNYSCIIFTNYVEQMNKIVESINYASDSYWGDPERFSFRAMIDSYTTSTELNQGEDRVVKTSFNISMMGHIVADTINAEIAGMNRFFSKPKVSFGIEFAGSLEELEARANTPEAETTSRFFDKGATETAPPGATAEELAYLSLDKLYSSDSTPVTVNGLVLTWSGLSFAPTPPSIDSPTKENFRVYVNGVIVESSSIDSIVDNGGAVVVTFNSTLGYSINAGDKFSISGKLA